jgi:hypothetical protein
VWRRGRCPVPADLREALGGAAPRHVPELDFDRLWRRHRRARARRTAAGVAAAAVAVLAAVFVLPHLPDSPTVELGPAAPPRLTPVEVAERYLEARNAYDVGQARALVAEDFRTNEAPDGYRDVDTMELAFEGHEAYGFHYADVTCSPGNETPERAYVFCEYLWTTELHRIGNHPPTLERLSVVIEDGRIAQVVRGGSESRSWWDPFTAFLRAEHPEFYGVIDRSLDLDPEATREVVELLPEYLALYEEWLDSQGG